MESSQKNKVPDITDIPILDGEEWDLSNSIDLYESSNVPRRNKKSSSENTNIDTNQS
jgi:hypothetical protein